MRSLLSLILLALTALAAPLTAAPSVTATLERDTITLGESTQLIISFKGSNPSALPQLPSVAGLDFQFAGTGTESEVINNQRTSTFKMAFSVHPQRLGDFTIPAFVVSHSRGQTQAGPFGLNVRPREPLLTASDQGNAEAFLVLVPPEHSVYLGQVLPITLELYVKGGQDLHLPQIRADGFTVSQPARQCQSAIKIGDSIYQVVVFKAAATPVKSGSLTLGPAECNLMLRIRTGNRGADPLFAEFLGGVRLQEANLTSAAARLQVLPLPLQDQPPDFAGAVGTFSMNFSAAPTNLNVGDPITLKLQISGAGALDTVSFPSEDGWNGFKLYPPISTIQTSDPLDLGTSGTKTFEQVVIPTNAAIKALPSISFSYFDPEKKQYQTLRRPPVPLILHPVASGPLPLAIGNTNNSSEPAAAQSDLLHIKPALSQLSAPGKPLLMRPWFLAVQSMPLIAFFAALAWRRRQDQLAASPRLRRRIALRQQLRTASQFLNASAAANDSEQFFSVTFHLLQEQLGERLDVPASAVTEASLDDLPALGAPPELMALLQELFQICNRARFAHSNESHDLAALIPKIETAISQIQKLNSLPHPPASRRAIP